MPSAILLKLSDNEKLSIDDTVAVLKGAVADAGVCWIPFLGETTPAAGRHEEFPYLVVAARGRVVATVSVLQFRKSEITGRDLVGPDDRVGLDPRFYDVQARAWLQVTAAPEFADVDASLEPDALLRGIKYLRLLDQPGHPRRWIVVSAERQRAPSVSAPPVSAPSGLRLPPALHLDGSVQVLGIDLTASSAKASAACTITVNDGELSIAAPQSSIETDDEIEALVMSKEWDCVALDGPRRAPNGWIGFVGRGEAAPSGPRSRAAERAVHAKIGSIFFFSPRARDGVKQWLERSTRLFARLEMRMADRLIEVFPHASLVALVNGTDERQPNPLRPKDTNGGCADREAVLASLLGSFSADGLEQGNAAVHDVVDAAAAAATALCHVFGKTVSLGSASDGGVIVVPSM